MGDFLFVGNDRCLDFVNTTPIRNGERVELLQRFSDLVAWLVEAAALDPSSAQAFLGEWDQTPESVAALERTLAFRKEMRQVAEELSRHGMTAPERIGSVNRWLRKPRRYAEIVGTEGRFRSRERWLLEVPLDVLAPLADFARELLCEKSPDWVRRCGNPDCVLYFYDTTKNHARRWCSMGACGNRIKVARFRARNR